MAHLVYLGLGSNLGDRKKNLQAAREILAKTERILQQSSLYQTAPWGYSEQPEFINQVIAIETELSPTHLLRLLKRIEKIIGRKKTFRYGPRVIDLDILLYDHRIVHTKLLDIPHPKLIERAFVLVPLAEIAPELVHPGNGKTIRQLMEALEDIESVKKCV